MKTTAILAILLLVTSARADEGPSNALVNQYMQEINRKVELESARIDLENHKAALPGEIVPQELGKSQTFGVITDEEKRPINYDKTLQNPSTKPWPLDPAEIVENRVKEKREENLRRKAVEQGILDRIKAQARNQGFVLRFDETGTVITGYSRKTQSSRTPQSVGEAVAMDSFDFGFVPNYAKETPRREN